MNQASRRWSPAGAGSAPGVNQDAIARAEAALQALASQFAGWLQDEMDKLDTARARVADEGLNAETREALYLHAHDLKGLGGTYGFPIITRIAGSLCRLIDEAGQKNTLSTALIDAHIDAIKIMVREDVRDEESVLAEAIAKELDAKVTLAIA